MIFSYCDIFHFLFLYTKNPDALGERKILFRGHRRFLCSGYQLKLIGQSFSALCASSLEDVSTVGSSHSLSEAVLFFSLTLFGLVSSKHSLHLLKFVLIPDYEISGIVSGSVLLYSHNTLYTMTTYIKTHFFQFVKSFFIFFYFLFSFLLFLLT